MGLYVARIHEEVKRLPLYVTRETVGFEAAAPGAAEPFLERAP